MPKQVKVEGRIITVPDDATPDEIDEIFKSQSKANPNQAMIDTAKRNLQTPQGGAAGIPVMSARPQFHLSDLAAFTHPGVIESSPAARELLYNGADKATNLLPAAGGITGGVVGAPGGPVGSIGGAALGGAAGESGRQLLRRAIFPPSQGWNSGIPDNSIDAAKGIALEGGKQGAYEAGGQILRAGGRVIAPKLAEAAAAPGKRLLKSSGNLPDEANIGRTILDETTGIRPKKIVGQLQTKIADKEGQMRNLVSAADQQFTANPTGAPSLIPARKVVDDAVTSAEFGNSATARDALTNLRKPLTTDLATDTPLPNEVLPSRIRAIKQQGVGDQIGTWKPEVAKIPTLQAAKERTYGALNGEFHRSVPGSEALDDSMSQLIPAKDAVYNTSFNPTLTRSVVERIVRPTGAAVGGIVGGEEGYRHGGVPGMVAGGITGFVLPNAIASPAGLMLGARAMNSGILPGALRYAAPIGEGLSKPAASKNKRPSDAEDEE